MITRIGLLLTGCLWVGCGSSSHTGDPDSGGLPDAPLADSAVDTGSVDGGANDGGPDGSITDSGTVVDAQADAPPVPICPLLDTPVEDAGTCPGDSSHTLTIEVNRGDVYMDTSTEDYDAVGDLYVVAFSGVFPCLYSMTCSQPDILAVETVEGADFTNTSDIETVELVDVPEGPVWIYAFLDDNVDSGGGVSLGVGDILTWPSVPHAACADDTVAVTLSERLVRVSGEMSVTPTAAGTDPVDGTLAISFANRGVIGPGDPSHPTTILAVHDFGYQDLGDPLAYELNGYAGPILADIAYVMAPARLYHFGWIDVSGDSMLNSDDIASVTGSGGSISAVSVCFDQFSIEFTEDISFNLRIP